MIIHQHRARRRRGPPLAGDIVAQLRGGIIRRCNQLASASDRSLSQLFGQRCRQTGGNACLGHRLGKQEHIGGSGTGNGGHRIHQTLIINGDNRPNRSKQLGSKRGNRRRGIGGVEYVV